MFTSAIIANVLLGTNAVSIKFAIHNAMDPLLYASLRFVLIGLVLLVLIRSFAFLKRWKTMLQLGLSSLLVLTFVVGFAIGVELSTALKASLFSLITPVVVYVLSIAWLHEPIIKRALLGGVVALVGGLLLVGLPLVFGERLVFGDVLLFAAYCFLGAGIVHAKYLFRWVEPIAVVSIRFLVAGMVILSGVFLGHGLKIVTVAGPVAWVALLYGVVIAGIIALSLYYTSLQRLRGEDAAPLFYLDPMVGILAAGMLLGERLDIAAAVGAVVIIVGVMIAHPHHGHVLHRYHVHTPHPLEKMRRGWRKLEHKL